MTRAGLDSGITAEHIEELALTGSVQLGPEFIPEHFDKLLIAAAHQGDNHGYRSFEKVALVYPQIRDIVAGVLYLSQYRPDKNPPLTSTVYYSAMPGRHYHQDFGGSVKGFSILNSIARSAEPGINRFRTAGRGEKKCLEQEKVFNYSDGPVLMAQKGYAHTTNPPYSTRATWHRGDRDVRASFVAFDITVPLR